MALDRYTDDQVRAAVSRARSWRGVLREIGSQRTSGAAIQAMRDRADRLGVDHSHFVGQRQWTDEQLRGVVPVARSWPEVLRLLGLTGQSRIKVLQGHALRLGLSVAHLEDAGDREVGNPDLHPSIEN